MAMGARPSLPGYGDSVGRSRCPKRSRSSPSSTVVSRCRSGRTRLPMLAAGSPVRHDGHFHS
ncbi:hypothetical protein WQQ_12030 [Hydrocarboniphaga effusa AP103]|uniref:Uncharacterized protein n=1 Tax=Hydrocarboniphaga effusa AP103 TaxID=1172194 RepID=I8I4E4_9GAMM|nr:hypothetical protein WQQ_12030 [Hydrocarboniphaga effusa AP103]